MSDCDSDENDPEDVAHVSLYGEGDWMHPPEGDEGSGYSREGDLSDEEIEAELQRLEERKQRRRRERQKRTLENIHREGEGDWFVRNLDWADDLPDLGTESVETPCHQDGYGEDDPFKTEHLPDLGNESHDDTDE